MYLEISDGVFAYGLGIYLPDHETLVLSDLHLGLEDSLRKGGVLVPRQHYRESWRRIAKIMAETGPIKRVVLNGDVKHEFGRISALEWREVKRFVDAIRRDAEKRGIKREIVVVKGNHDVMLKPIMEGRDIKVVGSLKLGDVIIVHGDEKLPALKGINTILMGHEHPAVVLKHGPRAERYKCFLVTTYKRKRLVVQPSFGPLTMGVDVLRGKLMSPLLGANARRGRVYIVDEKDDVLNFGTVSNLLE